MRAVLIALCFCATAIQAAQIPAGTELRVRLTTAVSAATAKPEQPVHAILISPVMIEGSVALPAGLDLVGVVRAATPATETAQAELDLHFTQVSGGGARSPIDATVLALDNSRETVDDKGKIVGIAGSQTFSSRLDQGISKLSNSSRFAALAGIIEGAKQELKIEQADPNISYEAGVEMTLRLNKAVSWSGLDASPFANLEAVPDSSGLIDLVNRQPFRTFAENPPRPSDMTNLMFLGTEQELRDAFQKAGWTTAARLSSQSKLETARAIIEARGYNEGPVSILLLDGHAPDMVFQKGNNTFAQRHHLRIFRRPGTFAGRPVWVCSSTHDIAIDFSERDRTFIHKIDSNIDKERAKVVNDLILTGNVRGISLVDRPEIPRGATNATGDALQTDGKMAVLLLGKNGPR